MNKLMIHRVSGALPVGFLLSALFLGGCHDGMRRVSSGEADPARRIESITQSIARNAELPSRILAANFFEHKIGDGRLGPSDFFFHARLKVAMDDLPKWTSGLKEPYNNSTFYSAPPQKQKWWITEEDFKDLKLYETKKYFGRFNGWMGFDESTGYIYVHTFTI
ncbi:MAG: hypothetical protein HN531_04000 [Opitutae bacterium]|nr:hypothetical protein [Opitutae bacterium]